MVFKYLAAFLFLFEAIVAEEPFGIDADLTMPVRAQEEFCHNPSIAIAMIRFHQEVISPADGPRSHYIPSSSQYTLEAMKKYGFYKGFLYGCDRLLRENNEPWVYEKISDGHGGELKWDPVP
jgi:uncharacterized protein